MNNNKKTFKQSDYSKPLLPFKGTGGNQPCPQSLLGVQNGGAKKTLANNRSRDHKISQSRACHHFETIQISNIFGDKWPAVCQGLLRAHLPSWKRRWPWGRGWEATTLLEQYCEVINKWLSWKLWAFSSYTRCSWYFLRYCDILLPVSWQFL